MLRSRQVLIAGGGIAGLTAAIAFAAKGLPVRVFERSMRPSEIGAGLQLSPNATRLLDKLDVLDPILAAAVRPDAVVLRRASTLGEIVGLPLGGTASEKWGWPYIVVHRADLHAALLARARQEPDLTIVQGATMTDAAFHALGATVSVDTETAIEEHGAMLVVGADGVWSRMRHALSGETSRFTGRVAWRTMMRAEDFRAFDLGIGLDSVTTLVHPSAHIVIYPVRAGSSVNVVAITRAADTGPEWTTSGDPQALLRALRGASAPLLRLLREAHWTCWPIHTVDPGSRWTVPNGAALIGDAAHALTPFAAQGAAMAIEDAWMLAELVAARANDVPAALSLWEGLRRDRLRTVARRAQLNAFAWHASGPVAIARDIVLRRRGGERLVGDLDWIYGYDAAGAVRDALAGTVRAAVRPSAGSG